MTGPPVDGLVPELLQALEDCTKQVHSLSTFAHVLIHAMRHGEHLPDVALDEYAERLQAIEDARQHTEHLIATFWIAIAGERPN